jgi:hypothetical protein
MAGEGVDDDDDDDDDNDDIVEMRMQQITATTVLFNSVVQ